MPNKKSTKNLKKSRQLSNPFPKARHKAIILIIKLNPQVIRNHLTCAKADLTKSKNLKQQPKDFALKQPK